MSSSSNRRRRGDEQVVDRISYLSDAILCHILSFVPTKSAVKTCILSKRWKYLWTQVPVLDFSEMPESGNYGSLTREQKISFNMFVDRILFHNDVSCAGHLCFDPLPADEFLYVKSWLRAISRRKFHKIEISVRGVADPDETILLPSRFLSSEVLVVLKLNWPFDVSLPTSLHLPNLEIIHLTGIQLPDDEFLKRLSSGCPVLKELHIKRCYGLTSTLYVESLTLKALLIRSIVGIARLRMVIKTPSLRCLCLDDRLTEYDICDLTSLVEADLDVYDSDGEGLRILRKVCGVKTLRLATQSQLLLGRGSELTIFGNLTCLKLEDGSYAYKILKCAPKLKSLIFERGSYISNWRFSSESETVPECLSCLESVEFCQFDGEEQEMRLVAYILSIASTLKEMNIKFTKLVKKDDVYQRLLMFPRASAACQVLVGNSKW